MIPKTKNLASLGRTAAAKTFTRNSNLAGKPRNYRQARTRGTVTSRGCAAYPKRSWGFLFTLVLILSALFALTATPALAAAPLVVGESSSGVNATEARLEAVVNPNNEPTECHFQYGTVSVAEHEVQCEVPLIEGEEQGVGVTVLGLTQHTVYHYRVILKNLKGEEAKGNEEKFETATPPEKPLTAAPAQSVTTSTATFEGTLNPGKAGEAGTYEFVYRESSVECQGAGEKATSPQGEMTGGQGQAVTAGVSELLPNATYTFCLLARNAAGETAVGAPVHFITGAVEPTLEGEASSEETRTSALLSAKVNPNGAEVTSCEFEYGTEAGVYPEKVACVPAPGAGRATVAVSAEATPLKENIEYHWRLTVENTAGSVTSVDHTFVYTLGGGGLPDGRQYELVTPAEKDGALLGAAFNGGYGTQVADKGAPGKSARIFSFSLQCFAGSPSCEISGNSQQGVPFEFAREPSGWVTHPLAASPASFRSGPATEGNVDAGTVLFQTPPPGASAASKELDWLGEQNGSFSDIGPVAEPGRGVPVNGDKVAVATPNLSHLVYGSLIRRLWKFDPTISEGAAVYEYEGSGKAEPRLVAIAPDSTELVSTCGSHLGGANRFYYNALSEDGETVYFSASPCDEGTEKEGGTSKVKAFTLYARYEHSRSELISGPAPSGQAPVDGEACDSNCQANPPSFGNFEGASSDGSRVFFTDPHQLTDGASEDNNPETENPDQFGQSYCQGTPGGASGCNLYESECPNRCVNPSERRLVDVSAGDQPAGGPRVLATVAISSDGSHVYFVARGALTGANREGHEPADGQPNLYMYERDGSVPDGRLSFVTTFLSPADAEIWGKAGTPGIGDANVTPDGRFLVFGSRSALTPDDTRTEAKAPAQIYRYDAETETLQRISIGAKGFHDNGNEGADAPFGSANIVEAINGLRRFTGPLRPDPTMSDDGSFVFFESPTGLTPHALNDVVVGSTNEKPLYANNVYEWEAPGTEVNGQVPCTEPAGCVSLISDGKDVAENDSKDKDIGSSVRLLGSSGSGANVFFTTSDELVPQDTDTERDFYDAHICSTLEPCPTAAEALPPCLGEVCHGIPAAQQGAPTGGTLTLNGLGNVGPAAAAKVKPKALTRGQKLAAALKVCEKRPKSKRASCRKRARAQYGPVKSKKRHKA